VLDLVIRGADVIDGTAAPRRRADLGVRDGRVVTIGTVDVDAADVIDATGLVITPGFIDVHTHYDASVFWDPAITPSSLHGVTTILAGNCGFTTAPLRGDQAGNDYLMRMLARVEGMPLEALQVGVPWSWQTTAEYLDLLDGNLGINAGFLVGHSALRRVVMAEDSASRRATPEEVASMQRLLREGLEAGGMGFSSSWSRTHNDADGHMVPSRYANAQEILDLCSVVNDHPGTSVEFIPMVGPVFEQWAIELMADMSIAAGRPLNWNVMTVSAKNMPECRKKLEAGDHARSKGGKVVVLTIPMSIGMRYNFASGLGLDAHKSWEEVMLLPLGEKARILADLDQRARLNDLAQSRDNPLRPFARWERMKIFDVFAPENLPYRGRSVGDIAAELNRAPWDVLCDIALADELKTSFGPVPDVDTDEDWKARLEVWRDPRAVIGASDAGAHLDMMATFNYTTEMLGQAVRDRDVLPLEEAVHLLTAVPADLYGLKGRGRIAEGNYADLVVLDPQTMGSQEASMRFDLPAGAGRLYAEADGIEHVVVNGMPIVRDGELTGARSGTLLRSGRDSSTPSLD
jgi:N-acyl-D-aspartate/D-glutamate deacylase